MEIIAAGVTFFAIGIFIGIVIGRSKTQDRTGEVKLLQQQNQQLIQEVRTQEIMLQSLEPLRLQVQELTRAAENSKLEQVEASVKIREQLDNLASVNTSVDNSTKLLAKALTQNTERGRWGEIQLSQIMQASGLVLGTNFVTQETFPILAGTVRPDCVVLMPDGSRLVIDSKVPFNKFYESLQAQDEQERLRLLKEHADALLAHGKELVEKNYHEISGGLEFIIMFLPFESLLSAAVEGNDSIITELAKLKIAPATPTGLIGLINLVGYIWRQDKLAQSTEEISRKAGVHLDHLNKMFDSIMKTRRGLSAAVSAFNEMVRRFENSVLDSAAELRDLGSPVSKPLPASIDGVDPTIRELAHVEVEIKEIESEPEG